MTELEPLIIKTLEEANIITTTHDPTSTQFECRRVVMDSLDIEPGTVICVGGWEAMRVVGNGDRNELVWVGFDGRTYTHEEFVRACRPLWDYLMKNTAAEFIRRAAFVDANELLKDECGVEYKNPSQVEYYALFKDHDDSKAINEALKHVADMLGCMTSIEYQESSSRVGEEMAVNTVRQVWQTALKTYTTTLNERVSNTGRFHTNEELADILRDYHGSIQVVDACDLH